MRAIRHAEIACGMIVSGRLNTSVSHFLHLTVHWRKKWFLGVFYCPLSIINYMLYVLESGVCMLIHWILLPCATQVGVSMSPSPSPSSASSAGNRGSTYHSSTPGSDTERDSTIYVNDPPSDGWSNAPRNATDQTEPVSSPPCVEREGTSDAVCDVDRSPEYIEAKVSCASWEGREVKLQ